MANGDFSDRVGQSLKQVPNTAGGWVGGVGLAALGWMFGSSVSAPEGFFGKLFYYGLGGIGIAVGWVIGKMFAPQLDWVFKGVGDWTSKQFADAGTPQQKSTALASNTKPATNPVVGALAVGEQRFPTADTAAVAAAVLAAPNAIQRPANLAIGDGNARGGMLV